MEPSGKAESRPEEEARVIWGCQIVPPDHTQCRNPKNVPVGDDTVGVRIVKQCDVLVLASYELVADRPNPTGKVDSIRTQMPCRVLLARHTAGKQRPTCNGVFSFGSVHIRERVQFDAFNPNLMNLHVIHPLGMGAEGHACFAVSKDGSSCCAIKFYHDPDHRNMLAAKECENWQTAYKGMEDDCSKVYTLELPEGNCLVMPYLHPIAKRDRLAFLDNGTIETVLRDFAVCQDGTCYFTHNEVKWRHLDVLSRTNCERVVLFDLGRSSGNQRGFNSKANDHIKNWVQRSIESLRRGAGLGGDCQVRTTPPKK